jgi:uncharacterized alkaline shock family protein YloU
MSGRTLINDSVFIDIAKEAMRKVEEVYKQDKKGGLAGFTQMFVDRFAPQISVKKTEGMEFEEAEPSVDFEVKVSVVYGVKIPEVAQKARDKIISEVETLTGYHVEKVDLIVERIVKPEDIHEEKKEEEEE